MKKIVFLISIFFVTLYTSFGQSINLGASIFSSHRTNDYIVSFPNIKTGEKKSWGLYFSVHKPESKDVWDYGCGYDISKYPDAKPEYGIDDNQIWWEGVSGGVCMGFKPNVKFKSYLYAGLGNYGRTDLRHYSNDKGDNLWVKSPAEKIFYGELMYDIQLPLVYGFHLEALTGINSTGCLICYGILGYTFNNK